MSTIIINNAIITLSNIDFTCPYCNKKYSDTDDKYLDRVNKNKSMYCTIKCECESRFGMCYDITGTAVSFKLTKKN